MFANFFADDLDSFRQERTGVGGFPSVWRGQAGKFDQAGLTVQHSPLIALVDTQPLFIRWTTKKRHHHQHQRSPRGLQVYLRALEMPPHLADAPMELSAIA